MKRKKKVNKEAEQLDIEYTKHTIATLKLERKIISEAFRLEKRRGSPCYIR